MSAILIIRSDWRPAVRPLSCDEALAAVGDVHGHDDLFAALGEALAEEMSAAEQARFVQLGDLVDRGPDSRAALLRAKAGLAGIESHTLLGNHEDRMLRAASGEAPEENGLWLDFGGRETLASFGVAADGDWPAGLAAALDRDGLRDWIAGLPTMLRLGPYLFVHAGVAPARPLAEQDRHTLLWTRRPFLDSLGPYPEAVAVIHGHTPTMPVALDHPHRINLDTGAFRTGVLSGLVVVGDRMRLVQAAR